MASSQFFSLLVLSAAVFAEPIIRTSTGVLHGFERKADNGLLSEVFLSVPYAKPPIGNLRFAKPQVYEDFNAHVNATKKHAACPQHDFKISPSFYLYFEEKAEDCLFLNIFRPKTKQSDLLPIVFYIHGGSFVQGSANLFFYDGEFFATETNTIYISVNYRVGLFGFITTGTEEAPGNQGLWDIVEALRWVKRNARSFGGDPDNITLWGQSAGGIAVGIFMASPVTKHLFQRAIFQSGVTSTGAILFKQNSPDRAFDLLNNLGCMNHTADNGSNNNPLSCLKQMDVRDVLQKSEKLGFQSTLLWQPIIGDNLIPVNPFTGKTQPLHSAKEVFVTSVASEGTVFVELMRQRGGEVLSDIGDLQTVIAFLVKRMLFVPIRDASRVSNSYFDDIESEDIEGENKLLMKFFGELLFICPNEYFIEAAKENGMATYRADFVKRFSYSPWPKYSEVAHADDVPMTSGQAITLHEKYGTETSLPRGYGIRQISEIEKTFAYDIVKILGQFATNG